MKRFLVFFLIFFSLEAREEVVVTIPKAGTHYLIKLIENITGCSVTHPIGPNYSHDCYIQLKQDSNAVVMWHSEPQVVDLLPKGTRKLLLIRDPRDVVLSAIDYIDKGEGWPGFENLNFQNWQIYWSSLTKKEKALVVLENHYNERQFSVVSNFETAIRILSEGDCLVLKYEDLSPECNGLNDLSETVSQISRFFKKELNRLEIQDVIEKSYKNKSSITFNKGKAYRYVDELDSELLELLNQKLERYVNYFGYSHFVPIER